MRRGPRTIRLPETFVYVAFAGTLACSSGGTVAAGGADGATDGAHGDSSLADVEQDSVVADTTADRGVTDSAIADSATADVVAVDSEGDGAPSDASDECSNPLYYCGPSGTVDGAVCPGPVCDLSMCPDAGCEPFV